MRKQIYISIIFLSALGIGVLEFTEAKGTPDIMSDLELSNIYGGCKVSCELADRCEKDWSPPSENARILIIATCAGNIDSPCDMEIGGDCEYDEYNPGYMWCQWLSPMPECEGEYTTTSYYKIDFLCHQAETNHSCGDRIDCMTMGSG